MAKIGLMIILSVVALILIFVGVGFFISSLYLYLVTAFHNTTMAAFFCGLSILLFAILLLLIAILIKSSLFRFKPPKLPSKMAELSDDPGDVALQVVQQYPFRSALVALASGFIVGYFPRLRDSLIDGVSTYLNTGSIAETLKAFKSEEKDND